MAELNINRKFTVSTNRVKCVDQHPTEPWIMLGLYGGEATLWNYETMQSNVIKVADVPVRVAKFIPRKNWVVTGCDDMKIRVFNYNTLEEEYVFEAHGDYIRSIVVHPTQPFILSSSDDQVIRLWNWERNFTCQREFKGHEHYVMQVVFNPKNDNSFASASLDKTVKVWLLNVSEPSFTLHDHKEGVNCVDYIESGPYLVSGADDCLVKIWDYQNKTCVRTLQLHTHNVTGVCFISKLFMLLTISEDGSVGVWETGIYRLKSTQNYGFGRTWTINRRPGSNQVAIGFDESAIIIEIGSGNPTISMDAASGKIIYAKDSEIQQINLKTLTDKTKSGDGETLPTVAKDMGLIEFSPKTVCHSPNGRFVAMCGGGEYATYTAVALRSKTFGDSQEFVWAYNGDYAILTNSGVVKIFRNFEEKSQLTLEHRVSGIFGGRLLGIASKRSSELSFYDWEGMKLVSRIEVLPRDVYWSENGELVCLATENACYVIKYDAELDFAEDTFTSISKLSELVTSGIWVGDCFVYSDSLNRIKYFFGDESVSVAVLDRPMHVIGYIAEEDKIYLTDRDFNIVLYTLPSSVLEYQTAVLREEFELADNILPKIPIEYRSSIARFLEQKSLKVQALYVATDPEHQFELALSLGKLETAQCVAQDAVFEASVDNTHLANKRWKRLGNAASTAGALAQAETCYKKAKDYSNLLLLAVATGNKALLLDTANSAKEKSVNNVAFLAYFILGSMEDCLNIYLSESKFPQAAFFARSYIPSQISEVIKMWKNSLNNTNVRDDCTLHFRIADPHKYPNLFSEIND